MSQGGRRGQPRRQRAPLVSDSSEVFVDTGAWFAVQTPDDRWHGDAVAALRKMVSGDTILVTTNHVIGETYTLLVMRQGLTAARRFVAMLRQSPRVRPLHVGEDVETAAWDFMDRFEDQPFSFVDGTSFATMRSRGLTRAFAFDTHFRTAGFSRIPVDVSP